MINKLSPPQVITDKVYLDFKIAGRTKVKASSQFKNNYFAEMGSGSEEGSYLRLIDLCITSL